MTSDNQEIQRSVTTSNDVLLQKFYESQNSRTTSSLDCYNLEMLLMNFRPKIKPSDFYFIPKTESELSTQINLVKVELPKYFIENKVKIDGLY
ncbi:hypothetical protein, partial [Flavobacterium sp.]|uniref:hypothetical protein n=1 Tax=Flavobacterium sp. TaxID=239 RepID=UPI002FDDA81E